MSLAPDSPRGPFVATALAWAMALALAPASARAADAPADDVAYDPFLAFDSAAGETAPAGGDGAAEPYRDRIIASAELEDLPPDEDEAVASGGAPRAAHVDVIASRNRIG